MGQQQLLLIVLGVIVVGIAIVVGINLFNANSVAANRDSVISDINNLGAMAMSHYKKPASMGGGANSFDGSLGTPIIPFAIPADLDTTANGTYAATPAAQTCQIVAVGKEIGNNGTTPIQYTASVNNRGVVSLTKNN
jgi:hypothetical protein